MDGYYKPGEYQTTNMYIHEQIINLLNKNHAVSIWILIDDGQLKYRNYTLNLADALEMALIKDIKYKIWNRRGRYQYNN